VVSRPLRFSVTVAVVLAVVVGCGPPPGMVVAPRAQLWHIVSTCLEAPGAEYCQRCRFPVRGTCPLATACEQTTEVWAQAAEYVAIRDLKQCGCPADFVHGLALPRRPVTGAADGGGIEGIWRFAWEVARTRIEDETEIALVVNPPDRQTQDHPHVHLVRLRPGARDAVAARDPERVQRLGDVGPAAARHAAARGTARYGVLVVREPGGDFLVLSDAGATEHDFTLGRCR
jgi:CDP-diacylglycerol pyrophosphatase